MKRSFARIHLAAAVLGLAALPGPVSADGLYADFSTSMGTFTAELDYVNAPRTVANFLGLAAGGQAWRDPETGAVRTNAFYDGTAFHLIRFDDSAVPGVTNRLAIQGGLRSVRNAAGEGAWTGGPGYTIRDEVTNGLTHAAGVLSMVQSGPHTASAEFLVTITNTAVYWDGRQTVFGQVVSNLAVAEAIAALPTSNGYPATAAVISNIAIRRVGAAAEAFDAGIWDLPVATGSVVSLQMGIGDDPSSIAYDVPPQSEYFVVHTPGLLRPFWTQDSAGFHAGAAGTRITNGFSAAGFGSNYFFHAKQSAYAVFSAIPLGDGIVFAAEWSDGTVHQYQLDLRGPWGNATGVWVTVSNGLPIAGGSVSGLRWRTRTAHTTQFEFFDNAGNQLDYTLGFDVAGARTGRYEVVATDALSGMPLGTEFGVCEYAGWAPGPTARSPGSATRAAATGPTGRWPGPGHSRPDWSRHPDPAAGGATRESGFRPGR